MTAVSAVTVLGAVALLLLTGSYDRTVQAAAARLRWTLRRRNVVLGWPPSGNPTTTSFASDINNTHPIRNAQPGGGGAVCRNVCVCVGRGAAIHANARAVNIDGIGAQQVPSVGRLAWDVIPLLDRRRRWSVDAKDDDTFYLCLPGDDKRPFLPSGCKSLHYDWLFR